MRGLARVAEENKMRWFVVLAGLLLGACSNGDIVVVTTKPDDTGSSVAALSVEIQTPSDGDEVAAGEPITAVATVSWEGDFADLLVDWTFDGSPVCADDTAIDGDGDASCRFSIAQDGELAVRVTAPAQAADASVSLVACGEEICDGIDNNCDGFVDNGAVDAVAGFLDGDTDGYGDLAVTACPGSSGLVSVGGDCDDGNPAVHPEATDLCDGIDLNCDGSAALEGDSRDCPATTCRSLLQNRPGLLSASGAYWIDAGDAADPFEAFCDLDDPLGGWTLVMDRRYADPCWFWPKDQYTGYPSGLDQPTTLIDLSAENAALTDDRWIRIRDLSTETMARAEENDASCAATHHEVVASLAMLQGANCVSLGDSLNTPLLAHAENDCLGVGSDYSLWFGSNTGWHWLTTLSSLDKDAVFFTPVALLHPWQARMFVR